MAVAFNHTIVHAREREASARFLAEILGRPAPREFGPFLVVDLDNGVSMDFIDVGDYPWVSQHYAFLVGEDEWDAIFGRIKARELPYWADPARKLPRAFNRHDGGRGVYFEDPDGHFLEILTRPYGSGE
jgi:catechol 2,3-dioxygenase-like lactoylglutathione lyase family enzyme